MGRRRCISEVWELPGGVTGQPPHAYRRPGSRPPAHRLLQVLPASGHPPPRPTHHQSATPPAAPPTGPPAYLPPHPAALDGHTHRSSISALHLRVYSPLPEGRRKPRRHVGGREETDASYRHQRPPFPICWLPQGCPVAAFTIWGKVACCWLVPCRHLLPGPAVAAQRRWRRQRPIVNSQSQSPLLPCSWSPAMAPSAVALHE